MKFLESFFAITLLLCGSILVSSPACADGIRKFRFSDDLEISGAQKVTANHSYPSDRGFGYLNSTGQSGARLFTIDLPEGNYDVTIWFGDPDKPTSTTVKAESRRLIFHDIETSAGHFITRKFTVNLRQPGFGSGDTVNLKSREKGPPLSSSWDGRLDLEFNGAHPGVAGIQITPNDQATTVFLAGDSTVTDQRHGPWTGWGQMLPAFFKPGIAVSNHAESGLALFSFESQHRLKKILSMMKKGDYLFIQFGHNDQKDRRDGAGAFTSYSRELKKYVTAFRDKGGHPVLVTPMERRRWKGGRPQTTLHDYAKAVRQVAEELQVPMIDLHAMSLELYRALGEKGSEKAFVFYPANAFPGQKTALQDNSHHSPYGAHQLARCIVNGIKTDLPELAKLLREDNRKFHPSQPDKPGKLLIPASPAAIHGGEPDGD